MHIRPHLLITIISAAVLASACADKLAEADELLATGDFAGAKAIYEARLADKPADGAGTIGMARTLYLEGIEQSKSGADTAEHWDETVKMMQAAVIIDPAPEGVSPVGEEMMADTLYRCGMKHYDASDWAKAAEMLASAEDKGKKTTDLYGALARCEAQRGETEAAMKAATKALKTDTGNVTLMREAAGWASAAKIPWMHHRFFAMAEKQKSIGLQFKPPNAINKGMESKYKALNMIGDVLATFLFEEELTNREWEGLLGQEPLILDMEKFIAKKPPKDFTKTDQSRLHWLVYHYWNATGVVFFYMGDFERAKTWLAKAVEIAKSGKVKHQEIAKDEFDKELTFAEENLKLVP